MLKDRFMFVYMKQLFREGTEVSKMTYNTTYKIMTILIYISLPNFHVFLFNFCVLPKCTVAQYATLGTEIL